jgi:YHS domain-containing protein
VDAYAKRCGLSFRCYHDVEREAVLDDDHQVRLNYETYFFSEPWMAAEFRADPLRTCGLLTDPVTKQRFHPARGAPRLEHEGVLYFFRTRSSYERFRRRPELYVLPGAWMI